MDKWISAWKPYKIGIEGIDNSVETIGTKCELKDDNFELFFLSS